MKAIFFDVDGVLVHGWHAKPELCQYWDVNIEQDLGIDRTKLSEEFFRSKEFMEILAGKKDLEPLLEGLLSKWGYKDGAKSVIDYWLRNDSKVNTDLIEKVKLLKDSGRVRLFIATNQMHERAKYLMGNLGFDEYFEDIFHSARAGFVKPDKEYFYYVMEFLGLDKSDRPVLFDDTPEVLESARSCGWDAYEYVDTSSLLDDPLLKDILTK